MSSEILNIQYNTGVLILKALNKFSNINDAAKALGICSRSLFNKISELKIDYDGKKYTIL